MNPKTRHKKLLENVKVRRWYENLKARSQVTSDTYLRNFGLWLEYLNLDPEKLITIARDNFEELKGQISDQIRKMENNGVMGASISTSIKPMISFLKFNNLTIRLGINIKNENRNLNAEKEVIPTKEELAKILRIATIRERVAISLIAFSGLRPEVLGNIDGSDGLMIGDIPDIAIESDKVSFNSVPVRINVRPELSKIRTKYFSFLGPEGSQYLKEYLENRISGGEKLTAESPVIMPIEKQSSEKNNKFLMTPLLLRRIKSTIIKAGFSWRPYIFRVYFGTNLDTAESKGLISHPWRNFIMGHKGDIEEAYTRREGLVEEGREQYSKCLKFIETKLSEESISENLEKRFTIKSLLLFGFSQEEAEKLADLPDDELMSEIKKKMGASFLNNGNKQRVIGVNEIEAYVNQGWEFISTIPGNKAIVRVPD